MSRVAELIYGIKLDLIIQDGYRRLRWKGPDRKQYYIHVTYYPHPVLNTDTTFFINNGFGLPEYIQRTIDNLIENREYDKTIHFNFKLPGIAYFQSLYLQFQIEPV